MSFGTPRTGAPRLCSVHHLSLLGKHPGAGKPARGVRPCGAHPAPISLLGGGRFLGRLGGETGRGRSLGAWLGAGLDMGRGGAGGLGLSEQQHHLVAEPRQVPGELGRSLGGWFTSGAGPDLNGTAVESARQEGVCVSPTWCKSKAHLDLLPVRLLEAGIVVPGSALLGALPFLLPVGGCRSAKVTAPPAHPGGAPEPQPYRLQLRSGRRSKKCH